MKLSNRINTINGSARGDDGWGAVYRAQAMSQAGTKITYLAIGDHDEITPPAILDAMDKAARGGATGYAPVNGKLALREALAKRAATRTGVTTRAENIFVGNGGQGALFAALMISCDVGDKVAIIDPHYTTYPATIRAVGAEPVKIAALPANGFQPDADSLMTATKGARALLINSPNNPTGAVYSAQTLEAIRAACLANDLWLISDEVYETQVHNGRHFSPRQLPDMAARTLVVGSLSKSHIMTGFRLGWCMGPEEAIAVMTDLTNTTTYGAPGFIQDAAIAALSDSGIGARTSALYRARRDVALAALASCAAIKVSPPQGAMYLFLDIRATGMSGKEFALALLEAEHISVMPGESFGAGGAGHIRIALTRPAEILTEALKRIAAFAFARAQARI